MKNLTFIKYGARSILAVAAVILAGEAFATSGYVRIDNRMGKTLCFAETDSFYREGEGSGSVTTGWTCVESGSDFRVDVDRNEYVYISAIDETGRDILENRLTNYSSVMTYAPEAMVETFGVEHIARIDGTFSYAYSVNDSEWTPDVIVADRDALEVGLVAHGFRKITGRVLHGPDVMPLFRKSARLCHQRRRPAERSPISLDNGRRCWSFSPTGTCQSTTIVSKT